MADDLRVQLLPETGSFFSVIALLVCISITEWIPHTQVPYIQAFKRISITVCGAVYNPCGAQKPASLSYLNELDVVCRLNPFRDLYLPVTDLTRSAERGVFQ